MKFTFKNIFVLISVICSISLLFNVYSFKKLSNDSSRESEKIEKYKMLLEQQQGEIKNLNEQIKEVNITQGENKKDKVTKQKVDENKENEIVNSATRFIEYAFNSSPETYSTRKKNAHNYMTDDLIKTIFSSDGIDQTAQDVETKVNNIEVYQSSNGENECVVFYNLEMTILSTSYKEENNNYVKLKFKKVGNQYKVAFIEPINVVGGV